MGEIIEALTYLLLGIYWILGKTYEKCTGREPGLIGAILLLLIAVVVCSGLLVIFLPILFPPKP